VAENNKLQSSKSQRNSKPELLFATITRITKKSLFPASWFPDWNAFFYSPVFWRLAPWRLGFAALPLQWRKFQNPKFQNPKKSHCREGGKTTTACETRRHEGFLQSPNGNFLALGSL
jgi:hypothetical protein